MLDDLPLIGGKLGVGGGLLDGEPGGDGEVIRQVAKPFRYGSP